MWIRLPQVSSSMVIVEPEHPGGTARMQGGCARTAARQSSPVSLTARTSLWWVRSPLPVWLGGPDLDRASESRSRNPSCQFDCSVHGVRFQDEVARDRSHAVNERTFASNGLPVLRAHSGCLLRQPKRQPGGDARSVVYRVVVRVDRLLFVLR